jgi:hypothetical protein
MSAKYFGGQPPWEAYPFPTGISPTFLPDEDGERASTYDSLESMYWSEDASYTLRVIVTEQPIYSPNPRIVVDTISHYLLKGLCIKVQDPEKHKQENEDLEDFLDREMFYPRFHIAKHGGCIRGDFCLHMTADPSKPAGKRVSLTPVHPGKVVRKFDDDDGEHVTEAWIVEPYVDSDDPEANLVRRLHYWYVEDDTSTKTDDPEIHTSAMATAMDADISKATAMRLVWSEEEILQDNDKLWGTEEEVVQVLNAPAPLPDEINHIPVFWFKNIAMDGQPFGSSDLRGLERVFRGVSQQTTDLNVAMALDGLGQYVTDAPPPTGPNGAELSWTIEPGMVQQVPNGNFFKRVEGVGSVQPMLDTIKYAESKIGDAAGITSVSTGNVQPATASNPMALAVNFLPTLSKIQERDHIGIARLKHVFHMWTQFREAYENKAWPDKLKILVEIGEKLPQDRTARVNELNNMLDRDVISKQYYREEMTKLGYEFPDDIQDQIDEEREKELEYNAPEDQVANVPAETALAAAAAGLQGAAGQGDPAQLPAGVNGQKSTTLPGKPNQSNNAKKTNESDGTESGQKLARQTTAKKKPAAKA